jgi:hypothetical protein
MFALIELLTYLVLEFHAVSVNCLFYCVHLDFQSFQHINATTVFVPKQPHPCWKVGVLFPFQNAAFRSENKYFLYYSIINVHKTGNDDVTNKSLPIISIFFNPVYVMAPVYLRRNMLSLPPCFLHLFISAVFLATALN